MLCKDKLPHLYSSHPQIRVQKEKRTSGWILFVHQHFIPLSAFVCKCWQAIWQHRSPQLRQVQPGCLFGSWISG